MPNGIPNSNTTLVKVKYGILIEILLFIMNSNTTLVKVKYTVIKKLSI